MEKLVGFVGYECEDIVIYLAKLLHAFGHKVAIVDRTEQEMLLEVLEVKKEKEAREGDFYGVWITDQRVCYEDYDVVFYLFGYRLIHPKLYECGALIMVTDGVPAHASLLRKLGTWERKQYLLIRNLIPMKHTEQYLALLADNESNYCEIPYDEKDMRMRYCMNSYAESLTKHLSVGMKHALMTLMQFLFAEYSERRVKEVMKRM